MMPATSPIFARHPFTPARRMGGARFFRAALVALALAAVSCLLGCSGTSAKYVPLPGEENGLGMVHLVTKGETLASIARYYGRDLDLLARVNQLARPDVIHPDDCLYIPPDNSDEVILDGRLTFDEIGILRRYHGQWPTGMKRMRGPTTKTAETLKLREAPKETEPRKPSAFARFFSSKKKADPKKETVAVVAATPPPAGPRDYIWPIDGQYSRGFSTSFRNPHKGVDIAAPVGRPIRAARDGRVLYSGVMRAYGKLAIVDHGDGFATLYAHCSRVDVTENQRVQQGDVIARVGATGRVTGPHLHFELRYKGVATDPEEYLPPFNGAKTLASKR